MTVAAILPNRCLFFVSFLAFCSHQFTICWCEQLKGKNLATGSDTEAYLYATFLLAHLSTRISTCMRGFETCSR